MEIRRRAESGEAEVLDLDFWRAGERVFAPCPVAAARSALFVQYRRRQAQADSGLRLGEARRGEARRVPLQDCCYLRAALRCPGAMAWPMDGTKPRGTALLLQA